MRKCDSRFGCDLPAKHAARALSGEMKYYCTEHFDEIMAKIRGRVREGRYNPEKLAKFKRNNPGLLP
jgi:hypothetical protein